MLHQALQVGLFEAPHTKLHVSQTSVQLQQQNVDASRWLRQLAAGGTRVLKGQVL